MRRSPLLLLLVASSAFAGDKLADLEAKRSAPATTPAERARLDARLRKLVGKPAAPLLNLTYFWNKETLAFDPARPGIDATTFGQFLRCHFTEQPTTMDMRLLGVLAGAAQKFGATRIEIVSGFRAPKYNLMLRKKGHEVARDSQHTYGHAVDFRIAGVSTEKLSAYVRALRLGGAGIYPNFVHADTGPLRTWAGN